MKKVYYKTVALRPEEYEQVKRIKSRYEEENGVEVPWGKFIFWAVVAGAIGGAIGYNLAKKSNGQSRDQALEVLSEIKKILEKKEVKFNDRASKKP